MNATTESILKKLGIGRRELADLAAFPAAAAILGEIESASLAEGRRIIAELAAAEAAHPAEQRAFDREAEQASRAFDAAELAHRAARDKHHLAQQRASGCSAQLEGKRLIAHRRLRELADPRLEVYLHHLARLIDGDLKLALKFWPNLTEKGQVGGGVASNTDVCGAGKCAAQAVAERVADAQLQALPAAEVTKLLLDLNADLAEALAPAETNAPSMTPYAEAGVPAAWRGKPEWQTSTAREFGGPEFLALRDQFERI